MILPQRICVTMVGKLNSESSLLLGVGQILVLLNWKHESKK